MLDALGLAGFGVKALSGIGSLREGEKQRKWQSQENEKERQYNSEEAQKNRDFQQSQSLWNAAYQAQYNSPSAQIQRLKDAGLNPALAYGQADTGIVTPAMTSGSQASSSASSVGGEALRAQGFNTLGQSMLEQAQIANINAQTEGEKLDNDTKRVDNAWREYEKEQAFTLGNLVIDCTELDKELRKANISETLQRYENLKEQFNNIKTEGSILAIQRDLAQNDLDLYDATFSARKDAIEDNARITHQTANLTCQYILSQIYLNNASSSNQSQQAREAEQRANDLSKRFELAIEKGEFEVDGKKVTLNKYELENLRQISDLLKTFNSNEATAYRNSVWYSAMEDFFRFAGSILGGYVALPKDERAATSLDGYSSSKGKSRKKK